jgi:hypothetical protein
VCTECRAACDTRCTALSTHKCNFSKAQRKLSEDGPDGQKHVGANIEIF